MKPTAPRVFIFEGPDFSGKSTTLANVASKLEEDYPGKVRTYRAPGGTPLGEKLRDLARIESNEVHETTMLYLTAIRSLYNQVVKDIEDGYIVLLDRWTQSTEAYQLSQMGSAQERDQYSDMISRLNDFGQSVIFMFTVTPENCQARMAASKKTDTVDRFERSSAEYQASVFEGYRKVVGKHRCSVIDSDRFTIPQMSAIVYSDILKVLN